MGNKIIVRKKQSIKLQEHAYIDNYSISS